VNRCNDATVPHDGLKRNRVRPRLALAFALRRLFCDGVSNARNRRTSSRMPSASNLFLSRFNARSTGSPLRTITSGIESLSLVYKITLLNERRRVYSGERTSSTFVDNFPPGGPRRDMSTTNTPQNANYFNRDVSKHGFSLFSVRATGESVFTYRQNASTHGLPHAVLFSSTSLAPSFQESSCKRVRNGPS
jgi:hypothetical protein